MNNIKRIISDIIEFNQSKPDNIYINFDKQNITKMKALIIGPKNTPYEDGYFFFDLMFPDNYPNSPPFVHFKTINGKVRFNPNLYQCGKVCLSILGTWSGPSWTPVHTLSSVLISIQSLLSEFPIVNEPGFEKIKPNNEKSINYNNYVIYNKYKLAIIDVLNKKYKDFICFNDDIQQHFKKNEQHHIDNLLSLSQILDNGIEIPPPLYFIKKSFVLNFSDILLELTNKKKTNKKKTNNIDKKKCI
jgi:ubiquitin-protein ligase